MQEISPNTAVKQFKPTRFTKIRPSSHPQDNSTLINKLMETFTQEEISVIPSIPKNAQPSPQTSFNLSQLFNMEESFFAQAPPIIELSMKMNFFVGRQAPERKLSASINIDSKMRLESKLKQA